MVAVIEHPAAATAAPSGARPGEVPGAARFREVCALEDRLVAAAGQANAAAAAMIAVLGEVLDNRAWEGWGLRSPAHWLSWKAGISLPRARALVRVATRLPELPQVAAAFQAGALSEAAVVAICRVATPANQADLLDMARHGTISQLERLCATYQRVLTPDEQQHLDTQGPKRRFVSCFHDDTDNSVRLSARLDLDEGMVIANALEAEYERLLKLRADERKVAAGEPEPAHTPGPQPESGPEATRLDALVSLFERALHTHRRTDATLADRYQTIIHIRLTDLAGDHPTNDAFWAQNGPALSAEAARRLTCDTTMRLLVEHQSLPLDIGRKTQSVPPHMRRALESRDQARCRYPGCASTRRLHAHHVTHWARGGPTALANLILLCPFHHKLVHEGGFHARHTPHGVRFYRPDQRPVPHTHDPPPHPPTLPLRQDIDHTTAASHWDGSRLQLSDAIERLQNADRPHNN